MATLEQALRECTVRIDRKGAPSGSGFFVAPGRVVTCAHVIQPHGSSSAVQTAELSVYGQDLVPHPVEAVLGLWAQEDADLAILTVRAGTDHPNVLLDADQMQTGDPLRTYGYPIDDATGLARYERGLPTTLEVEGELGGLGWLRLKAGQVEPGMSGSPVLNGRTGAVAGILKRSRDPSQALGGYAVPIAALLQRMPSLAEENETVHLADRSWLDLLEPAQQQAWSAIRGGASSAATAARHLVVTVEPGAEGTWEVHAREDGDAAAIRGGRVDLNAVRGAVARLFRAWAARGRIPEGEQIRTLGEILFSAAFPGDVGTALDDLLDGPDERVVVSLRFEDDIPDDFVNLPWEHLYAPVRGARDDLLLATDSRLGFARTLGEAPVASRDMPERSSLSVLVVAAVPDDDSGVAAARVDQAVGHLERLADNLPGLTMEVMRAPRPPALAQRIGELCPDVVHYVGLGAFVEGVDRLMLGGRGEGGLDAVTGAVLKQSLSPHPPDLVVLQLCEGGAGNVPADFAMLGPPLIRVPIPAVVAFQYPLPPAVGAVFCEAFYGAICDGKPVDMAVQEGRFQLAFAVDQPRGFVSPALFLLEPRELRLMRPSGAQPRSRPSHASPGPQPVFG